jgi:hypothetical protein
MLSSRRSPLVACLLSLLTLLIPASALMSAQEPAPTLVSARMAAAPLGTVSIGGEGFTPGGVVRLVIEDLWGKGPTVEHWLVTPTADLTQDLAYLTADLYGKPDSAQPTILVPITIHYMPPSDIDPAQGYPSSSVVWAGGCPDLVVQAWDAHTDTWSNQLGIDLAGC